MVIGGLVALGVLLWGIGILAVVFVLVVWGVLESRSTSRGTGRSRTWRGYRLRRGCWRRRCSRGVTGFLDLRGDDEVRET